MNTNDAEQTPSYNSHTPSAFQSFRHMKQRDVMKTQRRLLSFLSALDKNGTSCCCVFKNRRKKNSIDQTQYPLRCFWESKAQEIMEVHNAHSTELKCCTTFSCTSKCIKIINSLVLLCHHFNSIISKHPTNIICFSITHSISLLKKKIVRGFDAIQLFIFYSRFLKDLLGEKVLTFPLHYK